MMGLLSRRDVNRFFLAPCGSDDGPVGAQRYLFGKGPVAPEPATSDNVPASRFGCGAHLRSRRHPSPQPAESETRRQDGSDPKRNVILPLRVGASIRTRTPMIHLV